MNYFGIVTITITLLLTACVTMVPPSRGIDAGNLAYQRGEYEQARDYFSTALQLAMQQNWKPHIATSKYGLGRSMGQLCEFKAAEQYLIEAAELENQISQGKGVHLSQDYFELARLYYDYGYYGKAIPFFQKAIPLAEELGGASNDPIGYANVLEDYASALMKNGDSQVASAVQDKISMLRKSNEGRSAGFKIVRFKQKCAPNKVLNSTQ